MPEIGRFISEDPWKGTMLTPTTMNPYPYVLNNPLKYVDPSGLMMTVDGAGDVLYNANTKKFVYNTSAAEKAHKEVLNKQASKSSSPATKVSNQVQKQETKNGSDAIYGNLEERTLLDRVKQAGSGALDVIGGLGQVTLGDGIATVGTAASGGLLGGVAVAGGGSIVVVGASNIAGGGAKILDAITTQDLNESKVDFVEYVCSIKEQLH